MNLIKGILKDVSIIGTERKSETLPEYQNKISFYLLFVVIKFYVAHYQQY